MAAVSCIRPRDHARPVIVVGFDDPAINFTNCQAAAMIDNNADADNDERGRKIWVCDGPQGSWAKQWPRLAHLDA